MAPPLADQLTALGLRYTAAHLDDVSSPWPPNAAGAPRNGWSISPSVSSRNAPAAASNVAWPAAASAASLP